MISSLHNSAVWRFGSDVTALFDWDGVSAILLFATLLVTVYLANRQNRLQTRREAAALHGLSLLLTRWSTIFGISATLVSAEGYEEAMPDIDAAWSEIQKVEILSLPTASAMNAMIETRARAERALRPPTRGDILPRQAAHWEAALMDARDLSLFWSYALAHESKTHDSPWPKPFGAGARPAPDRPESRLDKSAALLAKQFRDGAEIREAR